jgi:hypothetical protein
MVVMRRGGSIRHRRMDNGQWMAENAVPARAPAAALSRAGEAFQRIAGTGPVLQCTDPISAARRE